MPRAGSPIEAESTTSEAGEAGKNLRNAGRRRTEDARCGGILTRCRSYPCRGTFAPRNGSGARAPGLLPCSRALTGLSFGASSGVASRRDVGAAVNMEDRRTLVRSFTRMCIRRVCLGIDSTIRDVSVSCVCVCRGTTRALQWRLWRGRADSRPREKNAFLSRKSPPGMLRDVTVLGLILGSKVPLKVSLAHCSKSKNRAWLAALPPPLT